MKKMHKKMNKGIRAAVVILAAVLLYLAVTTAGIVSFAEKDETRQADAAIVLGASVQGNSPSPVFCERIPLSLEEIFIIETEAAGYDVRNIL